MPLNRPLPAARQSAFGKPLSRTTVHSAMIAKTGAAARRSHLAAFDAVTRPSSSARVTPSTPAASYLHAGITFSKGGLPGVRHLHPFGVGRSIGDVTLVPVPPFVGPALGIAFRRVLPHLLTPECGHIEVAPDGAHRFIAATVNEVGSEHALAVANERIVAVPFVHAEIRVKAVRDRVPGDFLPTH